MPLPARRTCTFNLGAQTLQGLCDPNGHCYDVYKYTQAVSDMRVRCTLQAAVLNSRSVQRQCRLAS